MRVAVGVFVGAPGFPLQDLAVLPDTIASSPRRRGTCSQRHRGAGNLFVAILGVARRYAEPARSAARAAWREQRPGAFQASCTDPNPRRSPTDG